MTIDAIISQIDSEIAKLTQVRSLLASTGKAVTKVTEHINNKAAKAAPAKKAKKRRALSPEARKRIADAQHKRWAALTAKAKKEA